MPPAGGNGEPEPTAGNEEDCGAPVDDPWPNGPFTAGKGELPAAGAPPETGGNGLCAHAAPTGTANAAANTTAIRSPRAITVIPSADDAFTIRDEA